MFNWTMDGGELTPGVEFGPGWHLLEQGGAVPGNRYIHTMAALGDSLHLFGGYSTAAVNSHLRYDPDTQIWDVRQLLIARRQHSADVIAGHMYIFGGISANNTRVGTFYRYDPVTDVWSNRSNGPSPRFAHGSTTAHGYLWIHGGSTPSGATNDLWRYDPTANKWTQRASGGESTTRHLLATYNDHIYQLTPDGAFWRYSIAENNWTQLPNPPIGDRRAASFVEWGGYLWVWGGSVDGIYHNDLWRYDPAAETWKQIVLSDTLPIGRRNHATTLWGSKLVIHGGYADDILSDLWLLDLAQLV